MLSRFSLKSARIPTEKPSHLSAPAIAYIPYQLMDQGFESTGKWTPIYAHGRAEREPNEPNFNEAAVAADVEHGGSG